MTFLKIKLLGPGMELSFLFLLIVTGILEILSLVIYYFDRNFQYQWWVVILWLSGILIAVSPIFLKINLKSITNTLLKKRGEVFCLLLVISGAAFLRFYQLEEIPILGHDEARDAGLLPQAFLSGEIKDFFGYGVYGIPNMFVILASIPHLFFPKTVLAVKFLAALFGTGSVLLTWLLATQMFNQRVAMVSAILLSFYQVHLHFSRSEFINLFDSFWAPLIVLFLFLSKGLSGSLGLGIAMGLSSHFYQGIRALLLLVFFYFIFNSFKRIFAFLVGLIYGLGPSLVVIATRPAEFLDTQTPARMVDPSLPFFALVRQVGDGFWQSLGSLVYLPIDFHYRYGGSFFQFPFNLIFLAGFFLILKKNCEQANRFLIAWILFVLFFNSAMMVNPVFTHRLLSLVPALMIILAIGILGLTERLPRRYGSVFLTIIVFLFSVLNLKTYFVDAVWKKAMLLNTNIATPAGYYTRSFSAQIKFYFLPSASLRWTSWKNVPSWEYLCQKCQIIDVPKDEFRDLLTQIDQKQKNLVFIALPGRDEDFELVKQFFKGGKEKPFYFDGELIFQSYELLESQNNATNFSPEEH